MRTDPTLKRTTVVIKYTSSDGYRAELTTKGGEGTAHRVTGEPVPPQRALISALEELARLTALFGFEDEALEAFTGARQRVAEWRASRADQPPAPSTKPE
jgi:hypothetical protein